MSRSLIGSEATDRSLRVVARLRVTTAGAAAAAMLMVALVSGCSTAPNVDEYVAAPVTSAEAPPSSSVSTPQASPTNDAVTVQQEAVAPVGAAPAAPSTPVRIEIPSIGVDSDLIGLGLQSDGTMEVPSRGFPGGWYTGSPTPGELGPSIIAGHVDWNGSPGVFYDLKNMSDGDTIAITREDGSRAVFVATDVQRYPKSTFPTDTVYGDIDHAGLRLITCGGAYDAGASSYDDNVIAFAALSETVLP